MFPSPGRDRSSSGPKPRTRELSVEPLEDRCVPTVDFTVVNEWTGGMQGEIVIINDEAEMLTNWRLALDFDRTIESVWNADVANGTMSDMYLT